MLDRRVSEQGRLPEDGVICRGGPDGPDAGVAVFVRERCACVGRVSESHSPGMAENVRRRAALSSRLVSPRLWFLNQLTRERERERERGAV